MSPIGWAILLGLLSSDVGEDGWQWRRRQTLTIEEPIAAWRVLDVDGDGRAELLTADEAGRVVVRAAGDDGRLASAAIGGIGLDHPDRTLLVLAPAEVGLDLLVVDPDGVHRYPLTVESAGIGAAGRQVISGSRASNQIIVGAPRFATLASDVNGDGLVDLTLPAGGGVDLWLATGDGFEHAAHLVVPVRHSQSARADKLSDVLSERFEVPRLMTRDVNGDGREDLVVREGERRDYHLQGDDGAFPERPSVSVDLSIFRDTTPASDLAFGETLVLSDTAEMRSGDLTDDGIPDHVIVHRRKVWVFPAGPDGPQFENPSAILKTAEDVTSVSLVELDDDGRSDLLTIKLAMPSLGSLLVGMLAEFDVTITAAGYRNTGEGRFDVRPMLRSELSLRVPPLVQVLQRPEDLIERLESAEKSYRAAAFGDFDGDGHDDVALVGEEAQRLEAWRTRPGEMTAELEPDGVWLRRLIFEDQSGVFDVARIAELLSTYGDRRTRRLTGGRESDARIALGEGTGLPLTAALPADLDGDGRDELVCAFEGSGGVLVLDVLAMQRADD